jgi:hypothetical protein
MESIGKIVKVNGKSTREKVKVNKYLHSATHVLADELCEKLHDKSHFGFYLKMAGTYDHAWLRKLCAEVLENKNVQTPGRLFAYLIKKHNLEMNKNDKN